MPTRLKKPSIIKRLTISSLLVAFLVYLGFSALGGKFGTENRKAMLTEIELLSAEMTTLDAELTSLKHRISLFETTKIDPDILTERARALLSMARPEDIIIITQQ